MQPPIIISENERWFSSCNDFHKDGLSRVYTSTPKQKGCPSGSNNVNIRPYNRLKKTGDAIAYFTKGLEINPNDTWIYVRRGSIYCVLGEREKAEADFKKALEPFNKRIELDPNDIYAYFNRGKFYQAAGRYTEALEDYKTALDIDPEFVKAHSLLFELLKKQ